MVLLIAISVGGCASSQPGYDINATEALGRVHAKALLGYREVKVAPSSASTAIAMYGVVGFVLSEIHSQRFNVPVYQYSIRLESGREIKVHTDWASNSVGDCVKVFESQQSGYPRFVNANDCRSQSI